MPREETGDARPGGVQLERNLMMSAGSQVFGFLRLL